MCTYALQYVRGQQGNGGGDDGSGDDDGRRWCIIPFSQSFIHLCGNILNSENIIIMFTKDETIRIYMYTGTNSA